MTYCNRLEHAQFDKPDHSKRVDALKEALASSASEEELYTLFRTEIGYIFTTESSTFETLIGAKVHCSAGSYGTGGQGKDSRNKNGTVGSLTIPQILYCYLDSPRLRKLQIPIAHPDQCAMVLHLAKLDYYIGTESSMQTAIDRLTRLHDRLLFLDGLQQSDAIYKAYEEAEPLMHVLPSAQAALTDKLPVVGRLREVSNEVDAQLRQIAGGCDFYGHKADWVPRGSHAFYDDMTKQMLQHARIAEKAWKDYREADQSIATRLTAVREMRNQAVVRAQAARDVVQNLQPFLEASVITIGSMDFHLKECKEELSKQMTEQAAAIARINDAAGLDFGDIVEAATMITFCPNPAMFAVQEAGLIYKAVKDAKIENDEGEPGIKKALLVRQMTTLNKGTKVLMQDYQANLEDDRLANIEVDDPSASKLIAKKEDYLELVSEYSKAIGKENIESLSKAFDTYINAALDRNNQILTYNTTVNRVIRKRQEAEESEAKAVELSDEVLASIDPELPAVSIFMERLYSEFLWLMLESLSLTQRALRFWSLSPIDEIQKALQNKPPALLDSTTLSFAREKLLASYGKAVESFGKSPQSFKGIKYHLSDAELRRWSNHPQFKTIVRIAPVVRSTTAEESPFYGKANVRIHTVRFFAEGLTTDLDTVTVVLTHLGEETIVDSLDKQHSWAHEQIKLQFQYRVVDMAYNVDSTVDGNIADKTKGDYALVGPFTSWLIDINPSYNTGVVIKEVKKAWLEFSGEFYSF